MCHSKTVTFITSLEKGTIILPLKNEKSQTRKVKWLPQVPELVSGRAGIWTHAVWFCSLLLTELPSRKEDWWGWGRKLGYSRAEANCEVGKVIFRWHKAPHYRSFLHLCLFLNHPTSAGKLTLQDTWLLSGLFSSYIIQKIFRFFFFTQIKITNNRLICSPRVSCIFYQQPKLELKRWSSLVKFQCQHLNRDYELLKSSVFLVLLKSIRWFWIHQGKPVQMGKWITSLVRKKMSESFGLGFAGRVRGCGMMRRLKSLNDPVWNSTRYLYSWVTHGLTLPLKIQVPSKYLFMFGLFFYRVEWNQRKIKSPSPKTFTGACRRKW